VPASDLTGLGHLTRSSRRALEGDPVTKAQVLAATPRHRWGIGLLPAQHHLRATREFYWSAADAEKHSPDLKHTCSTGSDRSIEERKAHMNKWRLGECAP
jgi:hypothetical protein